MGNKRTFGATSVFVFAVLVACGGNGGGAFNPDASGEDAGTVLTTPDTGAGSTTFDTGTGVVTPTPDASTIGPVDTGIAPTDAAGVDAPVSTGEGGGGMCTPTCTSDSDCQSTCPSAPGAINCCDVSSGVCFTSASAQCPDVGGTTGGGDSGGGTAY